MEYYIRMSLRQWLALFVFYAMYVLLGTSIFYTIEHNLETERRAVHLQERIDINGKWVIVTVIVYWILMVYLSGQ